MYTTERISRHPIEMSKILIVDDNPLDHMITSHVLKTCYQLEDVIIMESAFQALEFIELNKNNVNELPSLIILDLDMPDLNGIGFLEKFAQYTQELKSICKIVVLTASEVIDDLKLMEADPNVLKLITKPLDKTALANVI
jgi:CheY-like chemotaxis protein